MWKSFVILLLVLGGLVYWDNVLSQKEATSRSSSSRVRQLIPPEGRESKLIAAIKLEDPGWKETFLYAQLKEDWRCVSRWGAVADEGKIRSLLEKLFSTQGIVQSKDPARAPDYGLGPASALRLSLHGQRVLQTKGEDLLYAFDIGFPIPQGSGCYVRVSGSSEVIATDANLREELGPSEVKGLPPLVDPHIIPSLGSGRGGLQRVSVDQAGTEPFELVRRDRQISPEELKANRLPWDWILKRKEEETCPPGPSNSFVNFLLRAPFIALLDPKLLPQLGLEKPAVRLVLYPSEGKPVEVLVGGKSGSAAVPVRNVFTQGLFQVSSDVAGLLSPKAEQLLDPQSNPWEIWFRQGMESKEK